MILRPTMKGNVTLTGGTRHRFERIEGSFIRGPAREFIVLQVEEKFDVVCCNSRQVLNVQTSWRDATPNDFLNNPLSLGSLKVAA